MNYSSDRGQKDMSYLRQKMELELRAEDIRNGMEVQKKYAIDGMREETHIRLAKEEADIADERELQRTIISLTDSGEIILQKERFGESIKGKIPIKLISGKKFSHINAAKASAMVVIFKKETGEQCSLFWNLDNLTRRSICRPFMKEGISFGFGERKENEIREKIVMAIVNIAKTQAIPEEHGWYQMNEKWKYAFPGELTWREVEKCY